MPAGFSAARRGLPRGALAGAGLLLLAAPAGAIELALAHFLPRHHPLDRFVLRPWSEEIGERTRGELELRIRPAGALGKRPEEQYRSAMDGTADIAFGLPGLTPERFPRVGVVELPGIAATAREATDALWDAMGELAPEFRQVKLLALWTDERRVLMTREKPIRSVADMTGLKFALRPRVPGEAIAALGAVPVSMPMSRAYAALQSGAVDGVVAGPAAIAGFRLGEVAKFCSTGWPLGRSPFFLVMNHDAFDRLPDAHKTLVERTTGRAMSLDAAALHMRLGARALDRLRDSDGHEVIALEGAALRDGVERLTAARAKRVKALDAKGVPASRILAAMGVAGG